MMEKNEDQRVQVQVRDSNLLWSGSYQKIQNSLLPLKMESKLWMFCLKNGNTKKKNEEEYQNATISILPFIYYQLILFT